MFTFNNSQLTRAVLCRMMLTCPPCLCKCITHNVTVIYDKRVDSTTSKFVLTVDMKSFVMS